jgi:GNAT superfamily N-acetyltransferase
LSGALADVCWGRFGFLVRYADEADIDDDTRYSQSDPGPMEAVLEIRTVIAPSEIASAVTIDQAHIGSKHRADYIRSVAERGGLSVAVLRNEVQAFCCLDHGYFFDKPFISLLIVSPHARRQGLGAGLLSHNARAFPEVWTSTNRSNSVMLKLLEKAGWRYCGEVSGLDAGDPEQFFKTA